MIIRKIVQTFPKERRLYYMLMFALVAIAHPGIFWLYYSLLSDLNFMGVQGFYPVSTNVYAINLALYLPFAILVYYTWITWQLRLVTETRLEDSRKKLDANKYLDAKIEGGLVISSIGMLNLFGWIKGMEGNVFGFLVFLPMLILTFASLIVFFVNKSRALDGKFDVN